MCLQKCPRCGDRAYEVLKTHDYCASCSYSNEYYLKPEFQIPKWALDFLGNPSKRISQALATPIGPETEAEISQAKPITAA